MLKNWKACKHSSGGLRVSFQKRVYTPLAFNELNVWKGIRWDAKIGVTNRLLDNHKGLFDTPLLGGGMYDTAMLGGCLLDTV